MSTKKSNQKKVAKATTVEQVEIEQPVSVEESVIDQPEIEPPVIEQPSQVSPPTQVADLKIDDIVPNPMNPRRYFDQETLSELSQNIKEHGVLQPVTVRKVSGGDGSKLEIVS